MKILPGDIFLLDVNIVYQRRYRAVMYDNRHDYVPGTVYIIDVFNQELNEFHPGHLVTAVNLSLGEECKITIFPAWSAHTWNVFLRRDYGRYFSGDIRLSMGKRVCRRGKTEINPYLEGKSDVYNRENLRKNPKGSRRAVG